MNKILKLNDFIKYIVFFILLGLFINTLQIHRESEINTVLDLYIRSYSMIYIQGLLDNIMNLIRWLIVHISLILIMYDYISQYFLRFGTLIFTRTNKRISFLKSRCIELFVLIFIFYFIQFLTSIVIGKINENALELGNLVITLKAILVLSLYQFWILLIINLLCLVFNDRASIMIILFVEIGTLLFIKFFINIGIVFGKWSQLIPTIDSFIITNPDNPYMILNSHLKYSYNFSIIYLGILILITFIIGCLFIKKIDLLEDKE